MTNAIVVLWGRLIGPVSWDETRVVGEFLLAPGFLDAGIEVAPLTTGVTEMPFKVPGLNREINWGLPRWIAGALPDRFGNRSIDA